MSKIFNKKGASLIEVVMLMAVISVTILATMNILIAGLNNLANLSRIQSEQIISLNILERTIASQYKFDEILEQSLASLSQQNSILVKIADIEDGRLIFETYFGDINSNTVCRDLPELQLQQDFSFETSEQICFLGRIQRLDQGPRLIMSIRAFVKNINESQSFNVILNEL